MTSGCVLRAAFNLAVVNTKVKYSAYCMQHVTATAEHYTKANDLPAATLNLKHDFTN